MLEIHRYKHVDWNPSPVVALAPSLDGAVVAAARENGAIELWSVSPGSVGWHCEVTIRGKRGAAISCLLWCPSNVSARGRLFSAGLDGFISEWDLLTLQPKEVVKSYGGSVWQMAVEPSHRSAESEAHQPRSRHESIRQTHSSSSDSGSDDDEKNADDSEHEEKLSEELQVAVACDDGCVRLFSIKGSESLVYKRSFPRVQGRILCVAWSSDAARIFSGGSDGCIRCWDTGQFREVYRITAGLGGGGRQPTVCLWSLLTLRDGTIVSGDSTGSTQFWDGKQGTLLQAHSVHRADVLALAASPSHHSIFAAGADGQVVQFQRVSESSMVADAVRGSEVDMGFGHGDKWLFVGSKRTHSHDVRALVVALPAFEEHLGKNPEKSIPRERRKIKRSWMEKIQFVSDRAGIPMLVSGGNDAKLFTYPANAFLAYHPHDVCHAPQRTPIQLALRSKLHEGLTMITQHHHRVDIWKISISQASAWQISSKDQIEVQPQVHSLFLGKRKSHDILDHPKRKYSNGLAKGHYKMKASDLANGHSDITSVPSIGIEPRCKLKGSPPELLARIKCKSEEHVLCSALSDTGQLVALSDQLKPQLFELQWQMESNTSKVETWKIRKRILPKHLPPAHCMAFCGASRLLLACPKNSIFVVDIESSNVLHKFEVESSPPQHISSIFPITTLCTSADGEWLAIANSIGDTTIFNLETFRQHWCVPPLDGSSITAALFHPGRASTLIVATSANMLHLLDLEARRLGEWSRQNGSMLPQSFLEFPGGIQGLSMPPSGKTTSIIAYGPRAMCLIDFKKPVPQEDKKKVKKVEGNALSQNGDMSSKKHSNLPNGGTTGSNKNFIFVPFKDPVLFLEHVANSSILLVEKPWLDVLHQLPPPVYRHLYGT